MNTDTRQPPCDPTWRGRIETTNDALLIFEACSQGFLHQCSRRPYNTERQSLIVSGNAFVYEVATSGVKRWTDGIIWSPSRVLTNFLIYRQLNTPLPTGEMKANKGTKRTRRPGKHNQSPDKDSIRSLVGSLVDSYDFKEGGLIKKTMTVSVGDRQYHLVSYYSLEDTKDILRTPRDDPQLKGIAISQQLQCQTKFKFSNSNDAGDDIFTSQDQHQYGGYLHLGGTHYPYFHDTTIGDGHYSLTRYTGQYNQYVDYWHYPPQQVIR